MLALKQWLDNIKCLNLLIKYIIRNEAKWNDYELIQDKS